MMKSSRSSESNRSRYRCKSKSSVRKSRTEKANMRFDVDVSSRNAADPHLKSAKVLSSKGSCPPEARSHDPQRNFISLSTHCFLDCGDRGCSSLESELQGHGAAWRQLPGARAPISLYRAAGSLHNSRSQRDLLADEGSRLASAFRRCVCRRLDDRGAHVESRSPTLQRRSVLNLI